MDLEFDLSCVRRRRRSWERVFSDRRLVWALRSVCVIAAIALASGVPTGTTRAYGLPIITLPGLVLVQSGVWLARRRRRRRMLALARANSLIHRAEGAWSRPSALVGSARNARLLDHFSKVEAGDSLTVGTMELTVERAGVITAERWGFARWDLAGVALPHLIVLAATPRVRSLPTSLDPRQKLVLEGDFPRSFDVYCPEGEETSALYILTPDLMARLVDEAGGASLELAEGSVMLFFPGEFDADDPRDWERVLTLMRTLAPHVLKRVDRFSGRSERSDPRASRVMPQTKVQPAASRLRRADFRSNRSTTVVQATCAAIVVGAVLWAWLHR